MEQKTPNNQSNEPTTEPKKAKKEFIPKQYPDRQQFEKAVQQLREEFERHPHPPGGTFY